MIQKIKNNLYSYLLWGTVAFFTILYFSLIFNHNIWTDEAFTLELIQGNLKEIVQGTARDVHPPLYYFWAKLFETVFGLNLQMQKIAAILPMTGTLIYLAVMIKKYFGEKEAFLSVLFLCTIPCSMEFAVQVRMYSLALLFVTVAGVSAYLGYQKNRMKDWAAFVLSAVAAAYTHYFAFVSVLFIIGLLFVTLLIQKRTLIKQWLISVICMLLLYLPWMKSFISQVTRVREDYWIEKITPATIWSYFVWTFDLELIPGTVYVFLLILSGLVVYMVVLLAKKKTPAVWYALLCLLVPVMTVVTGVVISLSKSPIYRDQYVFPAIALLAVFFGIVLARADKKLIALICAFLLFVGALQFKECYRQEYKSTYVPQTDAYFKENLTDEDFVVYNWETFGFIYNFYFPNDRLYNLPDFDFSQDFNTVYFLNTKWQPQIDQAILDANGLKMEFVGLYGIEHNEFDLYMIYHDTQIQE